MTSVGVCSWSLQPGSPAELAAKVAAVGIGRVQLHLDPIRTGEWDERETVSRLRAAGIEIASGMMTTLGEDYSTLESIARTGGVRPDETWEANLAAAEANAALAERLGIGLVTLHAGHLPSEERDPLRAVMTERLGVFMGVFGARGVRVGLETGQETAQTLAGYLEAMPQAMVNFDPANMILYGMGDPHEALEVLAPRVAQLHIKDATCAATPGQWGTEVPVGQGEVDWPRFLRIADERCPHAAMMIEREAGGRRAEDIAEALRVVRALQGDA